jgi:hypothetical protein
VGKFGAEIFPQALITLDLKIICKVLRKIYTPGGYRGEGGGGGGPWYGPGTRLTVSARASGPCSCLDCAPREGNYLQTPAWTDRPGGRTLHLRLVVSQVPKAGPGVVDSREKNPKS